MTRMRGLAVVVLAACVVAVATCSTQPPASAQTQPQKVTGVLAAANACLTIANQTNQVQAEVQAYSNAFSGTLTVQSTIDGTNWTTASGSVPASTLAGSGKVSVAPQSVLGYRVCATSYVSGSMTVTLSVLAVPSVLQYSPGGTSVAAHVTVDNSPGVVPFINGTPFPVACGTAVSLCGPTPSASPFATISPYPFGAVVLAGPSTAPAASAGAYILRVDSSGRAGVHDDAPVQPSPLYTSPVSGTVTNNCATNCTPNPAVTQTVHDPAPVQPSPLYTTPVSGTLTVNTPVPWTTASPQPNEIVTCRTCANFKINSSSTTGCNSISTTAKALLDLMNGASSQTVAVSFYDEGAVPTCAAADLIYAPTFGPSQIMLFASPYGHILNNGLAYSATTASIVGNIWLDYR